ncbi:DUF3099 domain-containing protein [Solwaraspora sp. WMMB335]|uniref:DUF3099 domain-containing protein n=1 Tax=Solwaraspora sp. WMMB335 TaxID=3404118 RepID=UPI003B927ACC
MRRTTDRPTVITDAAVSQSDQLRSRQRRYVIMMSIRGGCLVVGAVLVTAEAPLLWLWLPLCAIGMILVPWLAVLLANDRPPKDRHRLIGRSYRRIDDGTPAVTAVPAQAPPPGAVIDVDP